MIKPRPWSLELSRPCTAPLAGYLPIAEHGVVGDLHSAALVGTDGTIDWYCPERFDAPAVFGAILDRHRGGFYRIAPACADAQPKQLYLPNTNVLITRFLTPDGVGEVHDFMPIDAGPQRLVRRVVAVRGAMRFGLELEPRFDYARDTHEVRLDPGQARFISDHATLAFAGPAELTLQRTPGGVCLEFELQAGESHAFVLQTGGSVGPLSEEQADALERATADYWRGWLARSTYSGRWRETVHRSALALKLLSYQPTGAMVAAPTTSLPERIGGPRNWDYRFVWVRDFAFSLHALLRLGFVDEAHDVARGLTSLGDLDPAEATVRCSRSSTASTLAPSSPRRSSTISRDTAARVLSASATRQPTSCSSTSTAGCSTRCAIAAAIPGDAESVRRGRPPSPDTRTDIANAVCPVGPPALD
jgi:GH15 family glucan-1,4-alpha-glucosidase